MSKTKAIKRLSDKCIKQLRSNIENMRAAKMTDTQAIFDAFEVRAFSKKTMYKVEGKKSLIRSFFGK